MADLCLRFRLRVDVSDNEVAYKLVSQRLKSLTASKNKKYRFSQLFLPHQVAASHLMGVQISFQDHRKNSSL